MNNGIMDAPQPNQFDQGKVVDKYPSFYSTQLTSLVGDKFTYGILREINDQGKSGLKSAIDTVLNARYDGTGNDKRKWDLCLRARSGVSYPGKGNENGLEAHMTYEGDPRWMTALKSLRSTFFHDGAFDTDALALWASTEAIKLADPKRIAGDYKGFVNLLYLAKEVGIIDDTILDKIYITAFDIAHTWYMQSGDQSGGSYIMESPEVQTNPDLKSRLLVNKQRNQIAKFLDETVGPTANIGSLIRPSYGENPPQTLGSGNSWVKSFVASYRGNMS